MATNLGNFKKSMIATWKLGMSPSFETPGPWPVNDDMGLGCALEMLVASQIKGIHHNFHYQYKTIRKLRTLHPTTYESSSQAAERRVVFRGPRGETMHFSSFPTQFMLFTRFSKELPERIDRETKSDLALDHKKLSLIKKVLRKNSTIRLPPRNV